MSIKALQEYTYCSKYARYNKEAKRRETWNEACDRVMNMHLKRYPQASEHIHWAFDLVKQKKVLGSARAMQFGGEPIERKNERLFNCCSSYCDRAKFFQETMFLLLCGCGTGFSVQKHHVNKLSNFHNNIGKLGKKIFIIPDSIEGWADALGILIACYINHPEYLNWKGYIPEFNYSLIRQKGSSLSSGVGKAPGPEPLRNSLEKIRTLLDETSQKFEKLRPIDAYDIVMHASDAVLSGGIRRSATLCMFSLDDLEMMNAKTGNWFIENPQRGRSNNSVVLLRNETSDNDFKKIIGSVKEFGEPGFIWVDDLESLYNPCVEINYIAYDEIGNSGWCFCNLCEINGKKTKTKEDFENAAKAGAIIGTLQAGYTDFHYLGDVTKKIADREALLGVSITGIMDNPSILLDPKIQRTVAKLVLDTNEWMAKLIDINPCARGTCVKPAGTSSSVLGCASGIHLHHAKIYFRLVQGNAMESPLQYFKLHNPLAVEKSVWSANGTDEVIRFCVEVPDGAKIKNDLSAIEMLKNVKLTQQNWVEYGTRKEKCVRPGLRHNVSNTINVKLEEWDEVSDFIYDNRKHFAGVSLLPVSGDKDYPQAPFTAVYTPKEIVQIYGDGSLMASGLIVDGLHAFDNNLWAACDAVLGLGKSLEEPKYPDIYNDENINYEDVSEWKEQHAIWTKKIDWIRRCKQFAERYCNNDIRLCTYLLKDVSNWKLWCDLNREYKDVDYSLMHEDTDETTPMEMLACSGGSCQI